MNRTFLAIGASLSLLAFTDVAPAQDEQLPTPKAPYLDPVPDYGHWTVTFKYTTPSPPSSGATSPATATTPTTPQTAPPTPASASSSAPDNFPVMIDTIKTGDLRGIVLAFANGSSKQYTCQGNWVLTSTPKGPQLVVVNSSYAPYVYYTTGYVLLDTVKIDPSTFKEAAKHNGIMAFHYKSGDTDVWIDPKTMHPLAVKQPGIEVSYQFFNPPPRPFPIPQDQESLLQQERAAATAVKALR